MDRIINTKIEQQSIYEIYRACRLCGAGAGYKMPIIQNVVDLDASGIELRQKIQDCTQIEVHPDDKMPPLICELCVDKVNDFYEFIELCQQTNKRTRMRLGLPPQTYTRVPNSDVSSNSGDCILGVTEPVYQNDSDEPLAPVTRRNKQNESKLKVIKKENSVKHAQKKNSSKQFRREKEVPTKPSQKENSKLKRPPTPPRTTRLSKSCSEDTMSLSSLKQQGKKMSNKTASPPRPKSILKRESNKEKNEESAVPTRPKRPREPPKPEIPHKKVKLAVSTSASKSASTTNTYKPGPRSRRPPSPPPPPPPPSHPCRICGKVNSTSQALGNHLRSHTVQYTSAKLACDACQLWFSAAEAAQAHHARHRRAPYRCRRCGARHRTAAAYKEHIDKQKCLVWEVVPDKQCPECLKMFATDTLLRQHSCGGKEARSGGKCSKCRRVYSLLKNLKKHEATCTQKKKGADSTVSLPPARVLVARCDALLSRVKHEHYDVSDVAQNFGLDRNCVYPYISSYSVKSELPRDSMVKIKAEIDDYEVEDFVHWDSDTESDGEATKTVDTLSNLTLKKIFSKKCLGRVPKKRRKVKIEKNAFDSLLNASEFDTTLSRDINNIIDNLGNDDNSMDNKNDDNQYGSDEESLLTNYVLFDNAMVTNHENVANNVEDSNDIQSILDANALSGNSKASNENSKSNINDNDTDLDKDSCVDKKETKEMADECEKETVQELSKVNSDENNYKSGESKIDDSNVNNSEINKDNTTAEIYNKDENNEKESPVNTNNDSRIELKEDSADSDSNDNRKQEDTNIFIDNSENENIYKHCKEDISVNDSLENIVSNDIAPVNVNIENTVENKEIVPNNDSANTSFDTENSSKDTENSSKDTKNSSNETENPNNDIKNPNNGREITNNGNHAVNELGSKKISNGEVDEKSDKISFGDTNDVSDTEVDETRLMDAINEQISENNVNINGDPTTLNIDKKNHESEFPNEQNGAKNDLPNDITNQLSSNDHENAINELLSENNDSFINDVVSGSDDRINQSENIDNDCETDKISLEDLLPPKSVSKSMDLDSISDDDFDFDAC